MAETLTMNETPADNPEFTQEEMDSLKVGEEMETQQEQLLAGKYKNAEDLESAYIELQKKLGEPKEEVSMKLKKPSQKKQPKSLKKKRLKIKSPAY